MSRLSKPKGGECRGDWSRWERFYSSPRVLKPLKHRLERRRAKLQPDCQPYYGRYSLYYRD